MTVHYDAIVLGLGAMGSSAVYQLAKRGAKVIGFDRYAPPHNLGSTHGETRITRIACGEGLEYTPLAQRSHEIWRELEKKAGVSLFEQNGFASIAGKKNRAAKAGNAEFLEITIAAARKAAIDFEILDGKTFKSRYPAFNVADDDEVYLDRVGGYLQPETCVSAQLTLANAHGAEIHTGEQALAWEQTGKDVRVTTGRGSYTARTLILSAGPWLPEFIEPQLLPGVKVTRQIICWFAFRSEEAYRQCTPDKFPAFVWQVPAPQIVYGFPALGGREGGLKISTEQYDQAVTPVSVEREVSHAEQSALYAEYVEPFFPGLSPECLRAEVCLYTSFPDSRFIIDRHPRFERVIVASPCSGHGFKHSPAIGEALAQLALGEPHLDLSSFRFRV